MVLRDDEDALDSVQDAMLQLVRRYAHRPADEWRALFYRILQNRIRDYQRRRQVRNRLFAWWPTFAASQETAVETDAVADAAPAVEDQVMADQALNQLERSLVELPPRQQEAFMLRNFEGLDVAQTASVMGCSEGSVKTHYSRAVHALRQRLGETW